MPYRAIYGRLNALASQGKLAFFWAIFLYFDCLIFIDNRALDCLIFVDNQIVNELDSKKSLLGVKMARRNKALEMAEKGKAASLKRLRDLKAKIKADRPIQIGSTLAGAYAAGYVDTQSPEWLSTLGLENPSLVIGLGLVGYGLFSTKDGQVEKISTAAGTGMLSAYVYEMAKGA